MGVLCVFCAILVRLKCSNISASLIKPRLKDIKQILKEHKNLYTYGMIFCLFFTFQALLNYVPFELAQILGAHSGAKTGALYAGYALGGALGSFLPGFIYNYLGWIAFLCFLGVVCAFSLAFAIMLAKTRVYGVRNEN